MSTSKLVPYGRISLKVKQKLTFVIQLRHAHLDQILTLKAPMTTAADDKFCKIFPNFREKKGMIFHENRLPADDSYEVSCLICYF